MNLCLAFRAHNETHENNFDTESVRVLFGGQTPSPLIQTCEEGNADGTSAARRVWGGTTRARARVHSKRFGMQRMVSIGRPNFDAGCVVCKVCTVS